MKKNRWQNNNSRCNWKWHNITWVCAHRLLKRPETFTFVFNNQQETEDGKRKKSDGGGGWSAVSSCSHASCSQYRGSLLTAQTIDLQCRQNTTDLTRWFIYWGWNDHDDDNIKGCVCSYTDIWWYFWGKWIHFITWTKTGRVTYWCIACSDGILYKLVRRRNKKVIYAF